MHREVAISWYLALFTGVPAVPIVVLLVQDARRRKRTHMNEAESAYGAQRDLYNETTDIKTGVGRAMRDVDQYNGVKTIYQPKGRL
jgi:hypothetical protein